ncbi:hypothetical protein FGO68_gene2831 [Halteria grandinella]|uniref:CSD domain-containing protein n=1 Tax=Halteria grandinella TaxID=5974 RepID=A0A8J8NMP5_HALGN|nr:hypothetical protein FGO68_gene2831 [Halteria grandinella]
MLSHHTFTTLIHSISTKVQEALSTDEDSQQTTKKEIRQSNLCLRDYLKQHSLMILASGNSECRLKNQIIQSQEEREAIQEFLRINKDRLIGLQALIHSGTVEGSIAMAELAQRALPDFAPVYLIFRGLDESLTEILPSLETKEQSRRYFMLVQDSSVIIPLQSSISYSMDSLQSILTLTRPIITRPQSPKSLIEKLNIAKLEQSSASRQHEEIQETSGTKMQALVKERLLSMRESSMSVDLNNSNFEFPRTFTQVPNFPLSHGRHQHLRATGSLKFFYEGDLYGFLVGDSDGRDVFFHYDDMKIATNYHNQPLTVEYLSLMARDPYVSIRFSYQKLAYFGRYGLSMKAVNLEFLGITHKHPEYNQIAYEGYSPLKAMMAQELLNGSYSRFESAVPPYSKQQHST